MTRAPPTGRPQANVDAWLLIMWALFKVYLGLDPWFHGAGASWKQCNQGPPRPPPPVVPTNKSPRRSMRSHRPCRCQQPELALACLVPSREHRTAGSEWQPQQHLPFPSPQQLSVISSALHFHPRPLSETVPDATGHCSLHHCQQIPASSKLASSLHPTNRPQSKHRDPTLAAPHACPLAIDNGGLTSSPPGSSAVEFRVSSFLPLTGLLWPAYAPQCSRLERSGPGAAREPCSPTCAFTVGRFQSSLALD